MDYKDLDAWKKAIELVKIGYRYTNQLPKEETFGLISQIKRALVSIPSNIAEGSARNSDKEFIQFLYISLGSLSEIETQFIITKELGYLEEISEIYDKIETVRRLIIGLIKYLKGKQNG